MAATTCAFCDTVTEVKIGGVAACPEHLDEAREAAAKEDR